MNKKEVRAVEIMVRKCMNHLKKKDYELGITQRDVDRAVRITRVVDKSYCNGATYGGRNVIQINLSYWQHKTGRHYQKEYDLFDKCHVIGGRWCDNFMQSLLMTVAHEVAHHVQHSKGRYCRWTKKTWRKSHGTAFREIYALLRANVVNPQLPSRYDVAA